MKNILVPVGASENSASNLQYAIDLAHEFDANVYVVSVFQELSMLGNTEQENAEIRRETRERIDAVLHQVDQRDVSVIAHPIKGVMLEGIKRFASHIQTDLMVLSPRSNSVSDEVFLGNTSGMLLKGTDIPILIVPEGAVFQKPKSILMAFKNGNFSKEGILNPVMKIMEQFGSELHVLHVETPEVTEEKKVVSENLRSIQTSYKKIEHATTFQALLENFHSYDPDMVCVVRRKRGFFKLLWEKNVILKKEFHTKRPLLVLQVQD
ncbi:MAG TPA: universal stress protein [Salinimicrobium sp.]|nr:universal stress protein [Salinimicrobium sp.]